ncbi:cytochrome c oxidase assembly protein COX11, mitochondrial isoform X2 [Podarcis raffonei]|uniref:cytochrome c oxidase assembly protein COX11, mitochondrial isoform X2 n=1 Tax=Podarcis raffonei TaxID=65483 RepID=UPI0023290A24|nr:cytochrome c oxidase assembly protein COX11, mitochondrial isoform X2 [Podarcis raffonei]
MGGCARGWACLAAPAARGWGPWRAWLRLHGNGEAAACCGRRAKGSGGDPFAGARRRQQEDWRHRNKTVLTYLAAGVVGVAGMSYAAVPLYRLYCQATGLGGSAVAGHGSGEIETMVPVKDRIIKVTFNADVHASLQWNFRPQQTEVYCFCFEEQRLNPHEEVDMPVFFFIDPEFAEDPRMANVDLITLSYTFFEAKEGQKLPLPGYN